MAFLNEIASYFPDTVITNDCLTARFPEWSSEKVFEKIGIRERHIAGIEQCASDLAYEAAKKLLHQDIIKPDEVDFLLLCTQSPDYFLPTTACILQERLGLPSRVGALDFNLGCSGYVYGLCLANGLIDTGVAKNLLLVTAETYSKFIHPRDKGNLSLFGDAATASLITSNQGHRIGKFVLGTDGKGAENLIVRAGAFRNRAPVREEQLDDFGAPISDSHLHMSGPDVFKFTLERVPKLVLDVLEKEDLRMEDIDMFVMHQANAYMLEQLRRSLRIPREKYLIKMDNWGNTVSSSIPIALQIAEQEGSIKPGFRVLIAGFGVGYSWGGTVLYY